MNTPLKSKQQIKKNPSADKAGEKWGKKGVPKARLKRKRKMGLIKGVALPQLLKKKWGKSATGGLKETKKEDRLLSPSILPS